VLGNFKGWEILIIVALVLVLFGAKRLPDAARGLGRSLRIFKAETKGLVGEANPAQGEAASAPASVESAESAGQATPPQKVQAPQPERPESA